MAPEEAKAVVERAAEAGHFDDVLVAYFDAPSGSRAEAEAHHEIYFRLWDLVGGFEHIPDAFIDGPEPRLFGFRVSKEHWIDHLLHSDWLEIVPDERLVSVDSQLPLDVRARLSDDGRLARGGGNDEPSRR